MWSTVSGHQGLVKLSILYLLSTPLEYFVDMKMHIKPTTVQGAAFVALLAGGVGAAPPTTVSAATYAGANSADVYPPASSKLT